MTTCVCPACGFAGSLLVFTNDVDARHVAALMAKIPPEIAEPLSRYLAMFAPAKHKLTWPRLRKLLQQLLPDIERRAIERSKRQWPVSLELWAQGLEQMHEGRARLTLPLKSHGYLYEILAGGTNKAEAAAERAAEGKVQQEQLKRGGAAPKQLTEIGSLGRLNDELFERQVANAIQMIRTGMQPKRFAPEGTPPPTLEIAAEAERARFSDAVIDEAVRRIQPTIQQEQQHG